MSVNYEDGHLEALYEDRTFIPDFEDDPEWHREQPDYTDRFGFYDDTGYGDEDAELQAFPELRSSSNYCRHGTYIGTPWGGDFMCGLCESGEEPVPESYEVTITFQIDVQATGEELAFDKAWDQLRQLAEANEDMSFIFTSRVGVKRE